MSYKIPQKASEINKEASAIQQGNTLAILGATLITGVITGFITWAIEMITGTGDSSSTTTMSGTMGAVAGIASLLISVFISLPIQLGVDWSVLRLVDEDRFHIGTFLNLSKDVISVIFGIKSSTSPFSPYGRF